MHYLLQTGYCHISLPENLNKILNQSFCIIHFSYKNSPQITSFPQGKGHKLTAVIVTALQSSSFFWPVHWNHAADPAFSSSAAVTFSPSSAGTHPCYQRRPCTGGCSSSLHQQNLELGKARCLINTAVNSLSSLTDDFLDCNFR